MSSYMLYEGRNVSILREVSNDELEQLKQDAERVLGLRPAPYRDSLKRYHALMKGESEYLAPPPESDSTHKWATRILEVEPPAVEVWVGYPVIMSLSKLSKPEGLE